MLVWGGTSDYCFHWFHMHTFLGGHPCKVGGGGGGGGYFSLVPPISFLCH